MGVESDTEIRFLLDADSENMKRLHFIAVVSDYWGPTSINMFLVCSSEDAS